VHPNNTVMNGQWEDCEGPCDCDEDDLFNMEGRCVEANEAQLIVDFFKQRDKSVVMRLDDDFSETQQSIVKCPKVRTPADLSDFCKCSKKALVRDLQGNVKGGCLPPTSAGTGGFPGDEAGYCFLENIQDPINPTSSCFSDTQWSAVDGQFYSLQACQDLPDS